MELIGFSLAILTTAAFLPQVYKTWKTKDVSSLLLPVCLMLFIGVACWLIYGLLKESLALILANTSTIVSSIMLVYFKVNYRKR